MAEVGTRETGLYKCQPVRIHIPLVFSSLSSTTLLRTNELTCLSRRQRMTGVYIFSAKCDCNGGSSPPEHSYAQGNTLRTVSIAS